MSEHTEDSMEQRVESILGFGQACFTGDDNVAPEGEDVMKLVADFTMCAAFMARLANLGSNDLHLGIEVALMRVEMMSQAMRAQGTMH